MTTHLTGARLSNIWQCLGAVLLAASLCCASGGAGAQTLNAAAIDLPPCDASAPGMTSGVSVGLAQPYAANAVVEYATRLAIASPQVSVCSEPWGDVVPGLLPWAKNLERGYGYGAFVLAFLLVVGGLYAVTPRKWWDRTTLIGVLSVGVLTWLLGVLLLAGFHLAGGQRLFYGTAISLRLPQQARAEWFDIAGARELESLLAERHLLPVLATPTQPVEPAVATPAKAEPAGEYRVYHRLNLREAAGVHASRFAVINRGETVTYDGARDGDWWRIRSSAGQVGWASSLWLRRAAEFQ